MAWQVLYIYFPVPVEDACVEKGELHNTFLSSDYFFYQY